MTIDTTIVDATIANGRREWERVAMIAATIAGSLALAVLAVGIAVIF